VLRPGQCLGRFGAAGAGAGRAVLLDHPERNTALNEASTTIPIFDVFPIDPGETADFGFRAIYEDGDTPTVTFVPRLTALYVPFGPDGDNTLAFGD
jgi:hypothetical protein